MESGPGRPGSGQGATPSRSRRTKVAAPFSERAEDKGGALLDIGSAVGNVTAVAKMGGFRGEVFGVEKDSERVAEFQQVSKLLQLPESVVNNHVEGDMYEYEKPTDGPLTVYICNENHLGIWCCFRLNSVCRKLKVTRC